MDTTALGLHSLTRVTISWIIIPETNLEFLVLLLNALLLSNLSMFQHLSTNNLDPSTHNSDPLHMSISPLMLKPTVLIEDLCLIRSLPVDRRRCLIITRVFRHRWSHSLSNRTPNIHRLNINGYNMRMISMDLTHGLLLTLDFSPSTLTLHHLRMDTHINRNTCYSSDRHSTCSQLRDHHGLIPPRK